MNTEHTAPSARSKIEQRIAAQVDHQQRAEAERNALALRCELNPDDQEVAAAYDSVVAEIANRDATLARARAALAGAAVKDNADSVAARKGIRTEASAMVIAKVLTARLKRAERLDTLFAQIGEELGGWGSDADEAMSAYRTLRLAHAERDTQPDYEAINRIRGASTHSALLYAIQQCGLGQRGIAAEHLVRRADQAISFVEAVKLDADRLDYSLTQELERD